MLGAKIKAAIGARHHSMVANIISQGIDWMELADEYAQAKPFPHIVIDDFFVPEVAAALERDIPHFDDKAWLEYDNPIEKKRVLNHWDRFPPTTYRVFSYLNAQFLPVIQKLTGIDELYPDIGLNGGGWHVHGRGGKLNVHLDYSMHPKLGLERRLNLIVYLTSGWRETWGGGLGLWSHHEERRRPKELIRSVACLFNRAVLFDTTRNSWHGLPDPIDCPEGVHRRSIAVYYLSPPRKDVSSRGKALFSPTKEQESDPEVLDLIELRANTDTAANTYKR